MSYAAFEQVIGRALIDEAFRHLLLTDPASAAAGYDLTQAERAILARVSARNFKQDRNDGSIHTCDYDGNVISTLDFFHGLISEVGFPALDASSKDDPPIGHNNPPILVWLGLLVLALLLLVCGFVGFGPPPTLMGLLGGFGGGLCQDEGGTMLSNGMLVPAVRVQQPPGPPVSPALLPPVPPISPVAQGHSDFLPSFLNFVNPIRASLGQGLLLPPGPCKGAPPVPLAGQGSVPTEGPTATKAATLSSRSGDQGSTTGGGTCVLTPGDGVCDPRCENTDLDPACVCNNDNVCGPGEGCNCDDCRAIPSCAGATTGGGDGGKKKGGGQPPPCPPNQKC